MAIGLSPYTFPQEKYFQIPEEKKTLGPYRGVAGRTLPAWCPQARQCRKEGSSVTLDKVPIPPVIRAAWDTAVAMSTGCISQCGAHMVLLTKQKAG